MWPQIKGEVAHISLYLCAFGEVIAKINRVSAFLDHPVWHISIVMQQSHVTYSDMLSMTPCIHHISIHHATDVCHVTVTSDTVSDIATRNSLSSFCHITSRCSWLWHSALIQRILLVSKSAEIVVEFVILSVIFYALLMAIATFHLMAAKHDSCAVCDISDSMQ